MTNLIGCDYTCQRKKNINRLKELYESGLTKYYSAYNQYLQHKYCLLYTSPSPRDED